MCSMSYHRRHDAKGLALAPLDPQQRERLEALVSTLTPTQALWVSGYLAGLGERAQPAGTAPAGKVGGAPRITILYGTETGNARAVAEQLMSRLGEQGLGARAVDMAEYKTRDLRDETHVVLVSATHGEGDPPDPAAGFFEFLWSRKAPKLAGKKFAVLALGDSSYVHYCQAGRDLVRRFEELGAERIADRVDCDVDYEDAAAAWIKTLCGMLQEQSIPPAASQTAVSEVEPISLQNAMGLFGDGAQTQAADTPAYSRKNPYSAEILESVRLSGRFSDKETQHVELALEDSGLAFEPGDSLGIVPANDESTTGAVLEALRLSSEENVRVGNTDKPLGEALKNDLELTMVTPGFLKAYAEAAESRELRDLLAEDNREALHRFLMENQVPDVLRRYPVDGLSAQDLVDMLRKLQPRLYSIASSLAAAPDEVHLTVGVTRQTKSGKARDGVASTYLAERRQPGERVDVYVHPNKNFRLPRQPAAPIIMVGPGTGVAPFRAFLQEREETGAQGKNWLFFGERTMREDFLYQTEWLRWLKDDRLTRMDVAFSRDQAEKIYVQDRLREHAHDVFAWLEEGAHIYVCGDAHAMAPAVHDALLDIIRQEGDMSDENAQAYIQRLREERRYQRDVY